ncbi:MAG: hypothetical protein OIF51_20530 [Cellvibrionaceae bacterium]|nr:hypothetical protein [Cellvibrionaceae bacterium]
MDYVVALLTSFLAITGLLCETKKDTEMPISVANLTGYGKAMLACLVALAILGLWITYDSNVESDAKSIRAAESEAREKHHIQQAAEQKNKIEEISLQNQELKVQLSTQLSKQDHLITQNNSFKYELLELKEINAQLISSVSSLSNVAKLTQSETNKILSQPKPLFLKVQLSKLKALGNCWDGDDKAGQYYYDIAINGKTVVSLPPSNPVLVARGSFVLLNHASQLYRVISRTKPFTITGYVREQDGKHTVTRNWLYNEVGNIDYQGSATTSRNSEVISLGHGECKVDIEFWHQIVEA